MMPKRSKQPARRFFAAEDGTATIEAVIWLPLFIAFFCLIADASLIFYGQNQTYRIVQDANRQLSIGRLGTNGQLAESQAEVETFILNRVNGYAPNATAQTTIANGVVSSSVNVPTVDLMATGLLATVLGGTMTISAQHLVEF